MKWQEVLKDSEKETLLKRQPEETQRNLFSVHASCSPSKLPVLRPHFPFSVLPSRFLLYPMMSCS